MKAWFRKNWMGSTIVACAFAGVVVLSQIPGRKHDAPATEAPPVNVQVATVVAVPELPDTFDLPAVVEANRVVKVAAEVSGRIEKVAGCEGCPIQAGDLLIQINTDLLQAAVDRADASVRYDKSEHERKAALVKGGAIPARDAEEAAMHLALSQAQRAEAVALLDRARIVAPISGICNRIPVEKGEYVSPGNQVAELVDVDTVKVCVEVPERDVSYFRRGATAQVLVDVDGAERAFAGAVTYISETANNLTRSTRMEITVANSTRALRSGQIVRARLTRQLLHNVALVPLDTVIPLESGKKAVFVVGAEGTARCCPVQLGAIRGANVQVLEGLHAGDRLIVTGHQFVGDGQKVNVIQPAKAP